jgi:hypothetical protein
MMVSTIRTYSELIEIDTFVERYKYLALRGSVGRPTFGHERWLNQRFYTSKEWRDLRNFVIARDRACDLAMPEHEIHTKLIIHHMNPMEVDDIRHGNDDNFDPEFLITTTLRTHNAIHYGDESQLPRPFVERQRGDSDIWKRS